MTTFSHVWYASYGSNMDMTRFSHYILGGTFTGISRVYKGCDDKTLPISDIVMELPYQLYFAGERSVWTGGIAFVGHTLSKELTKSRAYLITPRQFEQIVAQESGGCDVRSFDISLLRSKGRLTLSGGGRGYDEMLYCGDKDGFPIITFTSTFEDQPYVKPASAYLKLIASSLRNIHKLSEQEVIDYFITKPGIAGSYLRSELEDTIR